MSRRERWNISRLAIAYPRLTIAFWLAVSVAGVFAFRSLKYSLLPDITFPIVIVNATAPLASAAEMESQITRPIEQRLKSLAGLDDLRASIFPGQTAVTLAFAVGSKLDASARAVETALKELKLPETAGLKVIPLNLNRASVVTYAIVAKGKSLADLSEIARAKIIPALTRIPGVAETALLGEPEARPVAGEPTLADAAPSVVRLDGESVLALEVIKRSDANTLQVVEQVRAQVERLHQTLPDVRLVVARTQADFIREASHSTVEALLIAVALSVLVIFPFLRSWPATLISALAIPTSLLGTAMVMAACGFELETITLLALALVIGIIIDDAIVDVENIARHLEEGDATPRDAALLATNEIGLTVTAATFTIVAVFLPVGLMHGSLGQFFKPFGVTVSAAVVISLLVARTLSPLLAVHWLKPTRAAAPVKPKFVDWYRRSLAWSLRYRWTVLALAALSFADGLAWISHIPKGFIPRLDRGEFRVGFSVALPDEMPDPRAGADFDPMKPAIEAAKKLEIYLREFPEVAAVFTVVGTREGEPNKGTLHVRLRPERKMHTAKFADALRLKMPRLDGVTTSVADIPFVEVGDQKPLEVALVGEDLDALGRAASDIADRLRKLHGFVDVTATSHQGQGAQVIEHWNTRRVAYVQASLSELSVGDATQKVVEISRPVLPAGVTLELGGDSQRVVEVFSSFGITLGLSVICILFVLVFLFRNWIDPLVILFSLPLAVVGSVLALLFCRSEFGMISLIGVIFLFGLVNKNAILLVDYINQLRRSGLSRTEAILRAGPVRLRPILMTTLATILGMMPIALGWGVGSELRAPMAIAIIGGLVTSTLLSLIVVPVVYALLDGWRRTTK